MATRRLDTVPGVPCKNWTKWQAPIATAGRSFASIHPAVARPNRRRPRTTASATQLPFGVEAVGDPAAVFGPGGYRHPLRPGIRFYFQRSMRQLCHRAIATSYVTAKHLQTQYPPNERAFTTHYSSIELPPSAFVEKARDYLERPYPLQLINVATMSQRYKGQQDLIEAVSACVRAGRAVQLALVGDGRYRPALEEHVQRARLTDRVRFLGQLPAGAAVRQALDQADVFVLSSLTEGLPRVLIEAQARGLPCLATPVGGVPELLAASECVARR